MKIIETDILNSGGLENLDNYKVFKRRFPQRVSLPTRHLTDWYLQELSLTSDQNNAKICLVGIYNNSLIRTSQVISIISARKICTCNCIYVLDAPSKVLDHPFKGIERFFVSGFPTDWENIIEKAFNTPEIFASDNMKRLSFQEDSKLKNVNQALGTVTMFDLNNGLETCFNENTSNEVINKQKHESICVSNNDLPFDDKFTAFSIQLDETLRVNEPGSIPIESPMGIEVSKKISLGNDKHYENVDSLKNQSNSFIEENADYTKNQSNSPTKVCDSADDLDFKQRSNDISISTSKTSIPYTESNIENDYQLVDCNPRNIVEFTEKMPIQKQSANVINDINRLFDSVKKFSIDESESVNYDDSLLTDTMKQDIDDYSPIKSNASEASISKTTSATPKRNSQPSIRSSMPRNNNIKKKKVFTVEEFVGKNCPFKMPVSKKPLEMESLSPDPPINASNEINKIVDLPKAAINIDKSKLVDDFLNARAKSGLFKKDLEMPCSKSQDGINFAKIDHELFTNSQRRDSLLIENKQKEVAFKNSFIDNSSIGRINQSLYSSTGNSSFCQPDANLNASTSLFEDAKKQSLDSKEVKEHSIDSIDLKKQSLDTMNVKKQPIYTKKQSTDLDNEQDLCDLEKQQHSDLGKCPKIEITDLDAATRDNSNGNESVIFENFCDYADSDCKVLKPETNNSAITQVQQPGTDELLMLLCDEDIVKQDDVIMSESSSSQNGEHNNVIHFEKPKKKRSSKKLKTFKKTSEKTRSSHSSKRLESNKINIEEDSVILKKPRVSEPIDDHFKRIKITEDIINNSPPLLLEVDKIDNLSNMQDENLIIEDNNLELKNGKTSDMCNALDDRSNNLNDLHGETKCKIVQSDDKPVKRLSIKIGKKNSIEKAQISSKFTTVPFDGANIHISNSIESMPVTPQKQINFQNSSFMPVKIVASLEADYERESEDEKNECVTLEEAKAAAIAKNKKKKSALKLPSFLRGTQKRVMKK